MEINALQQTIQELRDINQKNEFDASETLASNQHENELKHSELTQTIKKLHAKVKKKDNEIYDLKKQYQLHYEHLEKHFKDTITILREKLDEQNIEK